MTATASNSEVTWQERVSVKREKALHAIPPEWRVPQNLVQLDSSKWESTKINMMEGDFCRKSGILSDREISITESYDVAGLLKALASGQVTAVETTAAFSKRAAIAQQLTNCLTETFFPEAAERAAMLDAMRERGQLAGPLHGLPISIKDSFQVVGVPCTIGLVKYLDDVSSANSALVDILLELGAILYCKTNIPQTLMTADSHNNVFGRTLNPWNTSLTSGGSSGGEGAVVAMRGAAIGVGTDVAGSIRIPALCCGTYGFRPTTGRIPYGGQKSCVRPGFRPIVPCAGPLTNDIEALGTFMKAVISARPAAYDATAIDVPWRDVTGTTKSKLRIGVLAVDPTYPLHPPVKRVFDQAVRLVAAAGHEVVELRAEECLIAEALQVAWALFGLDNTSARIVDDAGEPIIPSRVSIVKAREKVSWEFVAEATEATGLERYAALTVKRAEISESWRKIWSNHKLDAVISPAAQNTAVEHDGFALPPYTVLQNLLDYPACVIPLGKVENDKTIFDINPGQCAPSYNAENLEGAPCSIQVFTSTMRDEECFEIAKVVDKCLKSSIET